MMETSVHENENRNEKSHLKDIDESPTTLSNLNELAKEAFERSDSELSKQVHLQKMQKSDHQEKHTKIGEYVKSLVFGGLDGIISSFSIVAAAVGSKLIYVELLIVAVANLIGDSFAMGLGDYFSSSAEDQKTRKLQKQYQLECEMHPEIQKEILVNTFKTKGFTREDSVRIVECLSQNTQILADVMLLEIEGIFPEEDGGSPIKSAFIMGFSFFFFGAVPLISFLFASDMYEKSSVDVLFWISLVLTCGSLFVLGAMKNFIMAKSWWRGGLLMLFVGGLTTAISYLIGFIFESFVSINPV